MGFNSIYLALLDIFPQVDDRILRAIAFENPNDGDAAVEIVLSEILPYLSKQSMPLPSSSFSPKGKSPIVDSSSNPKSPIVAPIVDSSSNPRSPIVAPIVAFSSIPKDKSTIVASSSTFGELSDGGVDHEEQSNLLRRPRLILRKNKFASSSGPKWIAGENARSTYLTSDINLADSKAINGSTVSVSDYFDAIDGDNHRSGNIESEELIEGEELILLQKAKGESVEVGSSQIFDVMSNTLMCEDGGNDDHSQVFVNTESKVKDKYQDINVQVEQERTPYVMSTISIHEDGNGVGDSSLTGLHNEWKDFDGPAADDFDMIISGKNQNSLASSIQDHTLDAMEHALHSQFELVTPVVDCEESEASGSLDLKSKQDYSISEMGDIGDEPTLNTIVTQSGEISIKENVEYTKNDKETVSSKIESIKNMLRELELQEKAVEQAKEEAVKRDLDKVEELKQMLTHANEANDMHKGEIYGEKAILATEVRELQTRTLSLPKQMDNTHAILDEMRQNLQAQLAEAEEMRKAAEQERLENEEFARNALAEQEKIMEKVVQESKILKQQAEENSKLRDFLMDYGRIVDTLQGEISVICQDVRLMKEKFDNRVPLSKSFSSSQSSCILASSGSSLTSVASDLARPTPSVDGQSLKTSPTPSIDGQSLKASPTPSIDGQSSESSENVFANERIRADRKELLDDGWDLFENDAELYNQAL